MDVDRDSASSSPLGSLSNLDNESERNWRIVWAYVHHQTQLLIDQEALLKETSDFLSNYEGHEENYQEIRQKLKQKMDKREKADPFFQSARYHDASVNVYMTNKKTRSTVVLESKKKSSFAIDKEKKLDVTLNIKYKLRPNFQFEKLTVINGDQVLNSEPIEDASEDEEDDKKSDYSDYKTENLLDVSVLEYFEKMCFEEEQTVATPIFQKLLRSPIFPNESGSEISPKYDNIGIRSLKLDISKFADFGAKVQTTAGPKYSEMFDSDSEAESEDELPLAAKPVDSPIDSPVDSECDFEIIDRETFLAMKPVVKKQKEDDKRKILDAEALFFGWKPVERTQKDDKLEKQLAQELENKLQVASGSSTAPIVKTTNEQYAQTVINLMLTRLHPYSDSKTLLDVIKRTVRKSLNTPFTEKQRDKSGPLSDYFNYLNLTQSNVKSVLYASERELLHECSCVEDFYIKTRKIHRYMYNFNPEITEQLAFLVFIMRAYVTYYRLIKVKREDYFNINDLLYHRNLKNDDGTSFIGQEVFKYSYNMHPENGEKTGDSNSRTTRPRLSSEIEDLYDETYCATQHEILEGSRWIRHLKTVIDKVDYISRIHYIYMNEETEHKRKIILFDRDDSDEYLIATVTRIILGNIILADIFNKSTKRDDIVYCRSTY